MYTTHDMQALEDDAQFVMGHVLVGASQCLSPLMHQDSLDAVTALATAADIVQSKGKQMPGLRAFSLFPCL